MARQEINVGIVPGDRRGDKLRIGGIKINENFTELYNFLSNIQSSPLIAAKHIITEEESTQLSQVHEIIPAPGAGKAIDLVSLVCRIIPGGLPRNNEIDSAYTGVLNVTMDDTNTSQLCGYFPLDFLLASAAIIQHMTPTFGNWIPSNHSVNVVLSNGCPWRGGSSMEFYSLYRIIDTTGSNPPGGGGISTQQIVMSFVNQSEITVQHDLQKYPTVVVVDTTGRELVAEVTHVSTDQMVIRLNPAASGKIIYS
jgi:hypothetical protein